ncbi:class I SAM-dependent methyltransferase [Myroides pelagicus]|uniref:Methyltransferase domain-containing protein n=1 Tax=Myroides pelagicus TaxID=270914 RepID=A0A7K1GNU2_9FLAO|nr:class I SAM-dependent methyltransferase [Myroides pelagicus]MEC4113545.1 class I SAM-dependent methyltransferase [Myroides pelagicus]MTH30063.1 methyltransferase domain-containing protein [Myroides pelagicus]
MKAFWEERYAEEDYAYGKVPNAFFKEVLDRVAESPGRILMVAEGEGRNAVYAAQCGWKVEAFDQSEEAKRKAMQLAKANQVTLNYAVSTMDGLQLEKEIFDAIALIYAHFPKEKRQAYHRQLSALIKNGGRVILEAFEQEHIHKQKDNPEVGGPTNIDLLYTVEQLKVDFLDFDFIQLDVQEVNLAEGQYHRGVARVIRLHGIKKGE